MLRGRNDSAAGATPDNLPTVYAKLSAGQDANIAQLSQKLAQANPQHGREIFDRTCLVCHKVYGKGGEIRPNITSSNRTDLNYILDNVLNPSGEIPEGYRIVIVTTRDGRIYSGNVASETDRQLTRADPVTIEKSDTQSR